MTHDDSNSRGTRRADEGERSASSARDDETAAAFGAVGNEHRVAILRALMEAYQRGETPIAYSTLKDRIGMRDSGQFNYHLQELVDRFVAESADGYALTYAGRTVVSAIASGALDESVTRAPEPVEGTCYACGAASLVIHYPGQRVRITCAACDEEVVHIQFPPVAVAARTVAELKRDFDRWARSWRSLAGSGICPECAGRIDVELGRETSTPTTGDADVRAVISCEQCWVRGGMPPGLTVLDHPAVVSFFWDRGIDVRDRPQWRHAWALADDGLTVVETDPLRVEVTLRVEDDSLTLRIDDSLRVESVVERRRG
ncbi:helix-turn-helix domain-containing protein [Halovivax limisalsi]|uniref:helix-turn-helix domain-containing protein n=1 Tax=Halovivax limisalsi TaxID=1453760 RepID=UPI001FFCBF34|nr:helix-turn-helix domain-containing protein [Halovivax limisalsi]